MPAIEVRISGGIFLFSLTYWSNCCVTARRSASTSLLRARSRRGTGVTSATKCVAVVDDAVRCVARCTPSTSTFTVPSGSLSICRMRRDAADLEHVVGATARPCAAAFCATSMMLRPASIAASSALMDLGRPTNSGMTMCGNTTTSRSGSSGSVDRLGGQDGMSGHWGILSFSGR